MKCMFHILVGRNIFSAYNTTDQGTTQVACYNCVNYEWFGLEEFGLNDK